MTEHISINNYTTPAEMPKKSSVQSKRLNYVDMVKGIAVLWVVFYHLISPGIVKDVLNHVIDTVLIAFFFYSGYFHKPGKLSIGENIIVRTKAVFVPFFKYSLLFWAAGSLYLIITKSETVMEALYCLRNFYAGCIWNRVIQGWFSWEYYSLGKRYFYLADFWFLIALFFASILFFLIADHVVTSKGKAAVTAGVLFMITGVCRHFAISLPYNIQIVPFWTAFMLLGALAGQEKLFEKPLFTGTSGWILSLALLGAGLTVSMLKAPVPNLFRGSFGDPEVVCMLLCILSALLVIPGLSGLCVMVEKSGLRTNELGWIGSHSLIVYIYHMFFAWIICLLTGFSLQYEEPFTGTLVVKSFLLALACLGLSVLRCIAGDRIAAA